jgi:hypothetical protein
MKEEDSGDDDYGDDPPHHHRHYVFYLTYCDVAVIMEATPAFCCFIYLLVTETLLVAHIRPI